MQRLELHSCDGDWCGGSKFVENNSLKLQGVFRDWLNTHTVSYIYAYTNNLPAITAKGHISSLQLPKSRKTTVQRLELHSVMGIGVEGLDLLRVIF